MFNSLLDRLKRGTDAYKEADKLYGTPDMTLGDENTPPEERPNIWELLFQPWNPKVQRYNQSLESPPSSDVVTAPWGVGYSPEEATREQARAKGETHYEYPKGHWKFVEPPPAKPLGQMPFSEQLESLGKVAPFKQIRETMTSPEAETVKNILSLVGMVGTLGYGGYYGVKSLIPITKELGDKVLQAALNKGLDRWIASRARGVPPQQFKKAQDMLYNLIAKDKTWFQEKATENWLRRKGMTPNVARATKETVDDTVRDVENAIAGLVIPKGTQTGAMAFGGKSFEELSAAEKAALASSKKLFAEAKQVTLYRGEPVGVRPVGEGPVPFTPDIEVAKGWAGKEGRVVQISLSEEEFAKIPYQKLPDQIATYRLPQKLYEKAIPFQAIPKAEVGMPEAGLQPSMLPEEVAAKEVKPYSEQEIANFRSVQEQQARQMAKAGTPVNEIAKELKVSEAYTKELLASNVPLPPPATAEEATKQLTIPGKPVLTEAQANRALELFGKYIDSPDTANMATLTETLRRAERGKRFNAFSGRAQELYLESGKAEEAMKQAIEETLSGKLPVVRTDYLDDLTDTARDVFFAKVMHTLKDEPTEMASTLTALVEALTGRAIPRKVGTGTAAFPEGGSAWLRLNRVFGDQPQVMKALEKMAEEKKPLHDVVEGIFRETPTEPIPVDKEMADYLRSLKTIPLGEARLGDIIPELKVTGERISPATAETSLQAFATEIAPTGKGVVHPIYEPPIEEGIKALRLPKDILGLSWPTPATDMIIRTLKEVGMSPVDIGGFLKAMKSSVDMSYWRQAMPLIANHKTRFALSNIDAWKAAFSQASAEAGWQRILHNPRHPELYSIYDALQAKQGRDFLRIPHFAVTKGTAQYKLTEEYGYLTEERLIPSLTGKIPTVKMSQRGFEGGLNSITMGTFEDFYVSQLRQAELFASGKLKLEVGKTFDLMKNMGDYAEYLANMSGRASLGKLANIAPVLANVLYAPRYALARATGPRYLFSSNLYVRKEAWKDAVMFVGVIGGTLMAGRQLGLWDVELNRNSADFAKIRIGNLRIDPWGGMQQFVVFYSRLFDLVTAPITGKPAMGKSSITGVEYPLEFGNLLENFAESKRAPLLAFMYEYMSGKRFAGEKVDVTNIKQWVDRIAPMVIMDIWDAIREDPLSAITAGVLSFTGFGVQTYTGDWKENATKLGLPKYSDNLTYGIKEPVYDVKDFWTDTASQFKGVDPATLTEAKGFPPKIKAIAEASTILKEIDLIPNHKLTELNADPTAKEPTFQQYYRMWVDRQAIVAGGDEKALKAFDADKRTSKASLGNMTQREFALLSEYHLGNKYEKAQFLRDHPELDLNQREEWLKSHSEENAKLAIWGQTNVLTQESYDKAMQMVDKLDIPDKAVTPYLPPRNIAKDYFEFMKIVDKTSLTSNEAKRYRRDHPELDKWGRQAKGWKSVEF